MISTPFFRRPELDIVEMQEADADACGLIHARRFHRAWSEDEIVSLLTQEGVFGYVARRADGSGPPVAFVLARVAADEGEILTIAVDPRHERLGLGWRLMQAAMRHLKGLGCNALFLEVDETNTAARALYKRIGFRQVGERNAYYTHLSAAKTTALVMRLDFG